MNPAATVPHADGSPLFALIILVILLLMVVSTWRIFDRAGYPGWGAIVPIYHQYIMLEIADQPIWWLLLFFIPGVDFIIFIIVSIGIAENFGRGTAFGIGMGLLPFIFYPILAFTEDPR